MLDRPDLDLAREAVTLPGWRWMPGTHGFTASGRGFRVVRILDDGDADVCWDDPTDEAQGESADDAVPDLADPATIGCLPTLVREAWGPDHRIETTDPGPGSLASVRVRVRDSGGSWLVFTGDTLAHALVAALRAGGSRG